MNKSGAGEVLLSPKDTFSNRRSMRNNIHKSAVKDNFTPIFKENNSILSPSNNVGSPSKMNFTQVDNFSDIGSSFGVPKGNGSFISINTPNNVDGGGWDPSWGNNKQPKPMKQRHSKNPSMVANTPYSIFLNIQPNINIIKSNYMSLKLR